MEDNLQNKFEELNNTPDSTSEFDPKDIEQNKVMAILAYFGILVLVPLFGAKESKFARFHTNQGILLCIASLALWVVLQILASILLSISWRMLWLVSVLSLLWIVILVLAIIGIINAANGKAKELPVIGKYKILK